MVLAIENFSLTVLLLHSTLWPKSMGTWTFWMMIVKDRKGNSHTVFVRMAHRGHQCDALQVQFLFAFVVE
jgi:hypothetical protein